MKALLLATGEGDNLFPLTAHYPAPMLPLANRPVMTYPVELMIRHRFRDIVVSLLRQAESIEDYCETGRRWNTDFSYLLQREALGSAGAIKRAQSLLTDTFLLMPGDALVDVNLTQLRAFHREHGGVATAVLAPRSNGKSYAPVARLDANSRICSVESNAWLPNALYFTNVFMFEPEVLELIPNMTAFDCQSDLLPRLLAENKAVYGYVLQDYWNPLETFADYQTAQQDYLRSLTINDDTDPGQSYLRHPYVEAGENGDGIWLGQGVTIHPRAQLNAPVLIGAGCQIGPEVTIGPNVILGPNCIVDDGVTIEGSTVLPDTYIGKFLKVKQKLISASTLVDIASEISVEMTDRALLGRVGVQTANALLQNWLGRLIALGMLLIAIPLLVTIALLTWLTGSGSALVRVPRIGRSVTNTLWGREVETETIRLYHLRTCLDDGAHTIIGRWLERWEIHRLPELLNVLLGDLALVGVKPLTEEEMALISEEWQRRRFDCPAGFSGRWYTEMSPNRDTDELFVADAYQTAMQSTRDLVQQIVKTPAIWWRRRKVVSFGADKKSAPSLIQSRIPRYVDDNPLK